MNTNELSFCCPNCGSNQVGKSIGGKLEHAAAWAATKGVKSYVMGDYGRFTGGAENTILKEEVPFQQVCSYCHHTFHARKSQIDAGRYALNAARAAQLMEAYNMKLQVVKDNEVAETRKQAAKNRDRALLALAALGVGALICATCEHSYVNFLGVESFTWTFMFSCLMIFFGVIGVISEGVFYMEAVNKAAEIEKMSIQAYAKDHKA